MLEFWKFRIHNHRLLHERKYYDHLFRHSDVIGVWSSLLSPTLNWSYVVALMNRMSSSYVGEVDRLVNGKISKAPTAHSTQ